MASTQDTWRHVSELWLGEVNQSERTLYVEN